MSENGRFCVQFSGTEIHSVTKTRILYKESKPNDVREIWTQIYDTKPPNEIQLIANHSTFELNDENDFNAVMAMAEDQYRAQPSNPLHITLNARREYKPNTPPSSNPSPEQPQALSGDCSKEFQEGQKSPHGENEIHSYSNGNSSEDNTHKDVEPSEEDVVHDLSLKKKASSSPPRSQPFVRPNVTFPNTAAQNYPLQRKVWDGFSENQSKFGPRQAHTPIHNYSEPSSSVPSFDNDKALVPHSSLRALSATGLSSVNSAHHQRLLQANPFFQSFRNNYERFAAINLLKQFSQTSMNSNNSNFPENIMDFKYLPDQNSIAGSHSLHKNKRKSNMLDIEGRKERISGKRMRSSSSQSNIEFHCEQAEKYMNLPAPLKKEHNSAHRSHWKHLSHVLSIWPQFATLYKHKKYDEWSSEARDIYAITLPEEYKWSFLTLAKQGDQLCRRIKRRVEEMRLLNRDQRPEWCPSDETLQITWAKADERLQQLERIRDARHSNPPSSSGSTKPVHQLSTNDHFAFSPQQSHLVNQASALHRHMFNDNGFSLLDQRALSFSGASKPLNTQQPYHSSATRSVLPTEMNFPTDMPCISSLPGRSSKYDSSETLQNPIDKTNFFYQRMKMLAANFQDHNASLPSTSDVKEERNAVETGLNWTKAAQTQPNSTPVSPRSPRHIG